MMTLCCFVSKLFIGMNHIELLVELENVFFDLKAM